MCFVAKGKYVEIAVYQSEINIDFQTKVYLNKRQTGNRLLFVKLPNIYTNEVKKSFSSF